MFILQRTHLQTRPTGEIEFFTIVGFIYLRTQLINSLFSKLFNILKGKEATRLRNKELASLKDQTNELCRIFSNTTKQIHISLSFLKVSVCYYKFTRMRIERDKFILY